MKIVDRDYNVDDETMMRVIAILAQVAKGNSVDPQVASDLRCDLVDIMEGLPEDN